MKLVQFEINKQGETILELPKNSTVLGAFSYGNNLNLRIIFDEEEKVLTECKFFCIAVSTNIHSIDLDKDFFEKWVYAYEITLRILVPVTYYIFIENVSLINEDEFSYDDAQLILQKEKDSNNFKKYLDNLSLANFTKYDDYVHRTSDSLKTLALKWRKELVTNKIIEIIDEIIDHLYNSSIKTDDLNEFIYEDRNIKLTKKIDFNTEYFVEWKSFGIFHNVLKPHNYFLDNEVDCISFIPSTWIDYLKQLGLKVLDKKANMKKETKEIISEEELFSSLLGKVLYSKY